MIYEITLKGLFKGNVVVNRWNYVSSGTPGSVLGSFGLANAFGIAPIGAATTVFGRLKTLVATSMAFTDYKVAALYDPEDFYSAPFSVAQIGLLSGEAQGPVNALGFRSNQVTTEIDRGTKRFAGVSENSSGDGGILTNAFMSGDMFPFAALMSAVLTYDDVGNTISYSPCILSRQPYVTDSGKTAYRIWPTEAEQLAHAAIGITWEPYAETRGQGTRQYRRGQ